jgi:hypothetical protein
LSAYSDRIISLLPLAYYRLGEASGAVAVDASGHGNNASYQGSPTLGQPGAITDGTTAVRLDGVDDQLYMPGSFSLPAGSSVTVEFWQYVATADVKAASAFAIGNNASGALRCQAHAPYTDKILYWDYSENYAAGGRVTADYTPYLDKWTHVVLTFDAATNKHAITLNGVEVASQVSAHSPNAALTAGYIGSSYLGFVKGSLDEFAVYNYALSPSDRLANYNAGITVAANVFFAADIKGNEARAGEWLAGQFLAGYDPARFAAALSIVQFVPATGGIAGQATVAPSLSVVHTLAAGIAGTGALVAQENPARNLGSTVVGASAVAPSLSVTNASFVSLDTDIHGQAAVGADTQVASTTQLAASVAGQAAVGVDIQVGVVRLLSTSVQGQAQVAAEFGKIISFSSSVSGQGAVAVSLTHLVQFEARIQTLVPICGENLCNVLATGGPFICGGFSGPHAMLSAGVGGLSVTKVFPVDVVGQASVEASISLTRSLSVDLNGQAQVEPLWLALKLSLVVPIVGQSRVVVKLILVWTFPTVPVDILLPPTVEVPWILVPTTGASADLLPTVAEDVLLEATEEEDWILIPTTERG